MFFSKNNVKSSEERKANSIQKIKELGIDYISHLPLREDSSQVHLKSLDDICKRAIVSLISIQLACDIDGGNYEESKDFCSKLLKRYNVQDYLTEKEEKLFSNNNSFQDVVDIVWTYEAYWSLVWALGLVDDIESPNMICDCKQAAFFVSHCKDYQEFKKQCKLRNIEEILDMLDLYYRYHWATAEKRFNPETKIGALNPDIVIERRRGLEWVISDEEDWDNILLDT